MRESANKPQAGIMTVDPIAALDVFYNDMDHREAEYWVEGFSIKPL